VNSVNFRKIDAHLPLLFQNSYDKDSFFNNNCEILRTRKHRPLLFIIFSKKFKCIASCTCLNSNVLARNNFGWKINSSFSAEKWNNNESPFKNSQRVLKIYVYEGIAAVVVKAAISRST
jgi:hypothetical protein